MRTNGWIVWRGEAPIGIGLGPHAAGADAARRTGDKGWSAGPTTTTPADKEEMDAARLRLPGKGLTLAEAAWCNGLMSSNPTHDRPHEGTDGVLNGAALVDPDHQRQGDTIVFSDDSRIVLVPVRRPNGRGYLVMLPTPERDTPSTTAPPTAGSRQTQSALPHRSLQHRS